MRADAARNRQKVLDAAFDVFTEKGISAPISEISARAGVGPGTVYRHFPTKEDLFRAVIADRFGRVAEYGQQVRASAPPGVALLTFLRTLFVEGRANRALADAIVTGDIDALDAESAFIGTLEELLREAQEAGAVRKDMSAQDLKTLLAACYVAGPDDGSAAETMLRIILDGLTVGAASTGGAA